MTSTLRVLRACLLKERREVLQRGRVAALHVGVTLLAALAPVAVLLLFRITSAGPVARALDLWGAAVPEVAALPADDAAACLLIRAMATLPALGAALLAAVSTGLSLAGERSGRTLEPLLLTPVADRTLLWGKLATASWSVYAMLVAAFCTSLTLTVLSSRGAPAAAATLPGVMSLGDLAMWAMVPLAALLGSIAALDAAAGASGGAAAVAAALRRLLPLLAAAACTVVLLLVWPNSRSAVLAGLAAAIAFADALLLRRALPRFRREELLRVGR